MIESYKQVMQNYATFSGCAGRSEYWWFTLANLIIIVGIFVLYFAVSTMIGDTSFALMLGVLLIIYGVAVLLPSYAVTVRRLHDIDKSAWWLLLALIPYVGGIILLILMALKPHPHPNKYGQPADWADDALPS